MVGFDEVEVECMCVVVCVDVEVLCWVCVFDV